MKVMYFPNQPHCYAFGGFEVQMLAAYDAARKQQCQIELLDPWKRTADFEIAHVWGLEIAQWHNITYSKKAGKKVIVTTLLPDFSSANIRLRFFASGLIDKVKILKRLTSYVDAFTVVNDVEKKYLIKFFNFPEERISVIPNIIGDTFFDKNKPFDDLGINDYVLCVGNVCERKNQLRLVQACNEAGLNVLLIGKPIEGEHAYASSVTEALSKNPASRWIKGVAENSNVLRSAYYNAKIFALVSYRESQPISILEALAANCRVLLADKPYAYQSFYRQAFTADPDSVKSIRTGLQIASEAKFERDDSIQLCTQENVGKQYKELYTHIGA